MRWFTKFSDLFAFLDRKWVRLNKPVPNFFLFLNNVLFCAKPFSVKPHDQMYHKTCHEMLRGFLLFFFFFGRQLDGDDILFFCVFYSVKLPAHCTRGHGTKMQNLFLFIQHSHRALTHCCSSRLQQGAHKGIMRKQHKTLEPQWNWAFCLWPTFSTLRMLQGCWRFFGSSSCNMPIKCPKIAAHAWSLIEQESINKTTRINVNIYSATKTSRFIPHCFPYLLIAISICSVVFFLIRGLKGEREGGGGGGETNPFAAMAGLFINQPESCRRRLSQYRRSVS